MLKLSQASHGITGITHRLEKIGRLGKIEDTQSTQRAKEQRIGKERFVGFVFLSKVYGANF